MLNIDSIEILAIYTDAGIGRIQELRHFLDRSKATIHYWYIYADGVEWEVLYALIAIAIIWYLAMANQLDPP